MSMILALLCGVLAGCAAGAQDVASAPRYDVVSIRPDKEDAQGREGKGNGGTMQVTFNGKLVAHDLPVSSLAMNLGFMLHQTVTDKTGLAGKYDFTLRWAPEGMGANGPDAGLSDKPPLAQALEEQLGLKLVPVKGAVDTLVVDHIEQPTEN